MLRLLILSMSFAPAWSRAASCPDAIVTSKDASAANRDAYASFFLTGKGQFWGSGFHVERFIDAVKTAADSAAINQSQALLVDVGAAPYNTQGGDISHVLTFASDEGLTDAGLKIRTMRLPDLFLDHDAPDKQYDDAGVNAPQIVDTVLKALRHNSAGVEEARA